ncbi:RNA-directed DNA polymerase, eukaryota [Tanacetum coccineum]
MDNYIDEKYGLLYEGPDFFGIQESKMGSVDQSVIRSLWHVSYVDYAFSSSMGASSGIITMWDTRLFSSVSVIDSRNFLGVIGSWVGISHKIDLLNVYAP